MNKNSRTLAYNYGLIQYLKSTHREVTRELLEYNTKLLEKNSAGSLPLSVTLKMRGISGFKVGNYITISNSMLPSRYRDKIAFRIDSIGHTVNEVEWETEISGYAFCYTKPSLQGRISPYKEPTI